MTAAQTLSFAYQAQSSDGQPVSGTIDAPDLDAATRLLHAMGVRVMSVAAAKRAARSRPLGGDDFAAFNDQLAHFASAGLPVEQGLRLLAADLKRGRLAQTIRGVVADLDRGVSLPDAVAAHRDRFPTAYATLIDAGIRSGDLSAMLLGLGRYVETVRRMRQALWRGVAYPLAVSVALIVVVLFITWVVLPQFQEAFRGFAELYSRPRVWARNPSQTFDGLPMVTRALFAFGIVVPWIALGIVVLVAICMLGWRLLRWSGHDAAFTDAVLVRLPLVGPALRMNLVARWCDAAQIATSAGLDLPAALALAADAVGSPALSRDSTALSEAVSRGVALESAGADAMLPLPVPAAIDVASSAGNLPATLGTLAEMHQRQAEIRVRAIPSVLGPILIFVVAVLIGFVIAGLMMPLFVMLRWITW